MKSLEYGSDVGTVGIVFFSGGTLGAALVGAVTKRCCTPANMT